MKRTSKRTLAFERLGSKCAPSTMLLALAPLDDTLHVAIEQSRESAGGNELISSEIDTSANWQFQFSTAELLRFVHENSSNRSMDVQGTADRQEIEMERPSAEQCRSADEMMKLGDHDLRALVIADALQAE